MFGEKKHRIWLFLAALCNVVIIVCSFIAINLVHISDVITISNASIVITAILCRIFLKEKLTAIHIIAFLMTTTGIIFISRPTFLFSTYHNQPLINNSAINESSNFEDVSIIVAKKEYRQYIGIGVVLLMAVSLSVGAIIFKKLANSKIHYAIINLFPSESYLRI